MSVRVPRGTDYPLSSGVHGVPWAGMSTGTPHPPERYWVSPGSSPLRRPSRDRAGCDPASPGAPQEQGLQVGDPKARGLRLQ